MVYNAQPISNTKDQTKQAFRKDVTRISSTLVIDCQLFLYQFSKTERSHSQIDREQNKVLFFV